MVRVFGRLDVCVCVCSTIECGMRGFNFGPGCVVGRCVAVCAGLLVVCAVAENGSGEFRRLEVFHGSCCFTLLSCRISSCTNNPH